MGKERHSLVVVGTVQPLTNLQQGKMPRSVFLAGLSKGSIHSTLHRCYYDNVSCHIGFRGEVDCQRLLS